MDDRVYVRAVWIACQTDETVGSIGRDNRAKRRGEIAKGLAEAFSEDTRIRHADEHITTAATQIEVHDFQGDRVVFDEAGVKVSAFAVNHGDLIKPSVGYRIDYGPRSVTVSGNTKLDENLIKHAAGSDLLIHEVFAMSAQLAKLPQMKPVADHHTSPEEAGMVFSRVKPKLAAYSHILLLATEVRELVSRTQSTYQGPLEIGEDLMRFTIGESVVAKNGTRNFESIWTSSCLLGVKVRNRGVRPAGRLY